jgi:hypothetical protein
MMKFIATEMITLKKTNDEDACIQTPSFLHTDVFLSHVFWESFPGGPDLPKDPDTPLSHNRPISLTPNKLTHDNTDRKETERQTV